MDIEGKRLGDIKLEPIIFIGKNAGVEEIMEKFNESKSGRLVMIDSNDNVVGVLKRKNVERFSAFRIAQTLVRK